MSLKLTFASKSFPPDKTSFRLLPGRFTESIKLMYVIYTDCAQRKNSIRLDYFQWDNDLLWSNIFSQPSVLPCETKIVGK